MTIIGNWKGEWTLSLIDDWSVPNKAHFSLERVGGGPVEDVTISPLNATLRSGLDYRVPFPIEVGYVIRIEDSLDRADQVVAIYEGPDHRGPDGENAVPVAVFPRPFPVAKPERI